MAKNLLPKNGRKINPVLLVILLVTMAVAVILVLTEDQSKIGETGLVSKEDQRRQRMLPGGKQEEQNPDLPEEPEENMAHRKYINSRHRRDPFLPPAVFGIGDPEPKTESAPKEGSQTAVSSIQEKPTWKGTIAGTHGNVWEKLVLLDFRGRTHLLQVGDLLPGSDYQLIQVEPDEVILQSAAGCLKLERRKGRP